jgi:hypothetical protein
MGWHQGLHSIGGRGLRQSLLAAQRGHGVASEVDEFGVAEDGADEGEHALGHLEVEDEEGGHSPTEVRRVPADVLDREVDGERRGPIRRQLELASSGMCSSPVGSGRRAGPQRAASRSGPLSSSYVAKPSGAAAGACVSWVHCFDPPRRPDVTKG